MGERYLLATHDPKSAPAIYSLAAILIISIGFSRLYLGVHFSKARRRH
jgi:membrane-associated phospholipid phosphatase